MANPVVWFEVMGEDASALRSFYGDLFEWKYDVHENMDYGMVEAKGGQGIPGGVGKGDTQRVTFYVATPSVSDSLAKAKKLGGRVIMDRTQLPGGMFLGMFADPQGNAIGLVEEAA